MKKSPTVGSLFSGIGGIDLGLERAGFSIAWQVERDEFARRVLAKHWPNVRRYKDVRKCGIHNLDPVDLVAGGPPCQPFSVAGKRRGEEDDRNLWPEMCRVIAELRPRWVLFENVAGIIGSYADVVLSDLEAVGYTTGTFTLPAAALGAPHLRERLFIVAYINCTGRQERKMGDTFEKVCRSQDGKDVNRDSWWNGEPGVGRMVHGVPSRLDKRRVTILGNAVVPQVAEFIGHLIWHVGKQYGDW